MTKNDKGRNRWHGATPRTTDPRYHTAPCTALDWHELGKTARMSRKRRRGCQRKRGGVTSAELVALATAAGMFMAGMLL
jgi:hypothetical protein